MSTNYFWKYVDSSNERTYCKSYKNNAVYYWYEDEPTGNGYESNERTYCKSYKNNAVYYWYEDEPTGNGYEYSRWVRARGSGKSDIEYMTDLFLPNSGSKMPPKPQKLPDSYPKGDLDRLLGFDSEGD